MTRQELYKKVKELGISKEIEKKFGQNFTRVSNTNLEGFINSYKAKKSPSKKSAPKKKVDETTAKLFIKLSVSPTAICANSGKYWNVTVEA